MKYTEERKRKAKKGKERQRKAKKGGLRMKNVLLGSIHRRKSGCRFEVFIFENNLVGQG